MEYVFAIEPEEKLVKKIKDLKRRCKRLVGDQKYLEDPAHITLYLGRFTEIQEFEQRIKEIAAGIQDIKFRIEGWESFRGDAVTGRDTLMCSIGEGKEALRKIQDLLVASTHDYREEGHLERYDTADLKGVLKDNLNKYGYPFVGDIWKPHISLASFDKEAYDKVWGEIKDDCPTGTYAPGSLSIFVLKVEGITRIRSFR